MNLKKAFGIFTAFFIFLIITSCASSPKFVEVPQEIPVEEDVPYEPDASQAIVIPVPKKTRTGYFSSIDEEVLALAEKGSPESLKQVISLLRKSGEYEYSEAEKVLLLICHEILSYAWPSSLVSLTLPEVSSDNAYKGALDSVQKGIYDLNTGDSDFFTILLPSLILFTNAWKNSYFDYAQSSITKALSLNKDSVIARYLYAVFLYKKENYNSSLEYFAQILQENPDSPEVLEYEALCYSKMGEAQKALETAEKLLESDERNLEMLKLCAENSFALDQIEKAQEYVGRVLQIEPENLDYVLFRARILMIKEDFIKASFLLDVYARTDKTNKIYLLLRAQLQRDWNKNNSAAIATITQAMILYPDDELVLSFAADLASSSSLSVNGYSALELAEELLKINAKDRHALTICMNEKIKQKDYKSAYELSETLVKEKNVSDEILTAHVENCLLLGKNDEAYRYASKIYSDKPSLESAQQIYLKTIIALGRYSESIQLINLLLPQADSKMKSFLLYERSFTRTDNESLLSDLRFSLTANPRNKDALYRLYEIYYARRDWKKARYYLKQVLALSPTDSLIIEKNAELNTLLSK